MFSLKEEFSKYKLINLKSLEENISELSDDVRSSIMLYNKAVESLRKGSEDIAIIELRKAVSINPGFHEARNLLGLCYAYTGEYGNANSMFGSVIDSERNGLKAYVYRKSLGGELPSGLQEIISNEEDKQQKSRKKASNKKQGQKDPQGRQLRESILKYAIGFVLGALLVFIPAYAGLFGGDAQTIKQQDNAELNTLREEKKALEEELQEERAENERMQNKYDAVLKDLEDTQNTIDYFTEARKLHDIRKLEAEGRYIKAAELVVVLDKINWEKPEKDWMDSLKDTVLPQAAMMIYEEGKDLCHNQQKFMEGLKKLEKVSEYQEDFPGQDGVLYYMGKCYQGIGQYDSALECYNKILNDYPGSYFLKYANYRKNEIKKALQN